MELEFRTHPAQNQLFCRYCLVLRNQSKPFGSTRENLRDTQMWQMTLLQSPGLLIHTLWTRQPLLLRCTPKPPAEGSAQTTVLQGGSCLQRTLRDKDNPGDLSLQLLLRVNGGRSHTAPHHTALGWNPDCHLQILAFGSQLLVCITDPRCERHEANAPWKHPRILCNCYIISVL